MYLIQFIKEYFNQSTMLVFILIGIISLILDAPRYKAQNATKELKIIKVISYTYIAVGVAIFILLQ